LAEALDQVLDGARTVEMGILSDQGMLRPRLGGRLTLLPVVCGVTGLISALGCIDLDGPTRHPPRRFRIERDLGETLSPPPRPAAEAQQTFAKAQGGGRA
jgi:hypothetical protein